MGIMAAAAVYYYFTKDEIFAVAAGLRPSAGA